tara:strand:+ start:1181 stop:1711 length:531 start_codon:yes stop_codon:yes gene_type:complete
MPFKLIVATDEEWGIGKNNKIPWKCSEDLKHFSKKTKGNGNNAIVLGRKTWDSLNRKPLPNRDHYILSRTELHIPNEFQKNTFGYTKINDLIHDCLNKKYDDVWIIGGQQIYTLFMQKNIINELYITKISGKHDCDTFFTFDQNLYKVWSNEASDKHMLTKLTSIPSAYYQIWRPV